MRSILLALACAAAAFPAAGDDAGIRRCREVRDSAARLACYDALPLGGASAPAPTAAAPPRASAAASAPPKAPAAAAAGPEASFGMENRAPPRAELAAVESYIPGTFLGWSQYTTVRLANGQLWQVMDEGTRRMSLKDPKVRVRRGMMGAFYLEFEAHNWAPRVRRLE